MSKDRDREFVDVGYGSIANLDQTAANSELAERLNERLMLGGISGGEQQATPNYSSVLAEGNFLGVIFDQQTYEHEVLIEDGLHMHTIKARDGREAYFEVNDRGMLYGFLCFGLNIELWQGLLVVGDRSYKDDESDEITRQTMVQDPLAVAGSIESQHRAQDAKAWITNEEPDIEQRRALARAILRSVPDGSVSCAPFSVDRKGDDWTISGSKSSIVLGSTAEVENIMAAIAWADAIELDLRDQARGSYGSMGQ